MGVQKAAGEYIEEMTEPAGWPDIDEELLAARASEFVTKVSQLLGVLEGWQRQHSEIFQGGVWSGGAANVGNGAVQDRVNEMV